MICEVCQKNITNTILDRVLSDREKAIKRMNKRSNHGKKEKYCK